MKWIVIDTGNPWVSLNLPVPVPAHTLTPEGRVRVSAGFPKGTGTGMLPMGTGTGIYECIQPEIDIYKNQLLFLL